MAVLDSIKTANIFFNLCQHKADFGIEAKRVFFATSHGKQPYDSIGGTIRHLTAKASLQRPYSDQILTSKMMFQYCVSKIQDIKFIYIAQENLNSTRLFLETRFEQIKCPISGTRSFHELVPFSELLSRDVAKTAYKHWFMTLKRSFM